MGYIYIERKEKRNLKIISIVQQILSISVDTRFGR